jgi:putative transposase
MRYMVFFVIDIQSRRVHVAGIHEQPYGDWMAQMARQLTDCVDGFLTLSGARYLIHDRDTLFTPHFSEILKAGGVKTLKLPARSPNLNSFAERFVGSIRRECLNHVIPLGEAHLRRIVTEYVAHYNTERNHQGLDNRLLCARPANDVGEPSARDAPCGVKRRQRLGGLLNFYYLQVA